MSCTTLRMDFSSCQYLRSVEAMTMINMMLKVALSPVEMLMIAKTTSKQLNCS